MLAQYKSYLQSCYEARALAPADKYLPTLQAPYINLAMIKSERHDHNTKDEFTRRTLHGGVDQILASKSPININDLLVPEEGSKPVRFILVEGPPGIGKSTFAWELCRRWDEIESLRSYHTVVLLRLREKWVLNATKPSDLFRYPPDPELSAAIAKDLNETHGQNLLLVLDGFDEVSHSFHKNSVIKSILCRQLFPKCTIILTTRPSAKHTLESVCQPEVDKHIEIIGFTDEERVRYITEVFRREPELQVNFLKYMFLVPHIKSMMYIPLNCAIIAQVYYESQQSSHHLAIPRTRTQLYKALTHSLLLRYMKSKDSNCQYSCMLPEGLNKEDMKKFKILAKFAFDSYHTGAPQKHTYMLLGISRPASTARKVTFFKEDIPEGLVHFGFMTGSTELYIDKGVEQAFSFLHLSLQEYLAGWHLAHSYSTEFQVAYHWQAVDPYKNRLYRCSDMEEKDLLSSLAPLGESLVEPAVFLAGITGFKCQSNLWQVYLSHDTAHTSHCKLLLLSLYEAQNEHIIPQYFTARTSRKRVLIGSAISNFISTPYDFYALSYCLAHFSDHVELYITIEKDYDVSLVEILVKGLEDHCMSSTPSVENLDIKIHTQSEEISNKAMFWLMKAKFLPAIEKLHFQPRVVNSDVIIIALLKSLVKLQSLEILIHPTMQEWLRYPTSLEWLAALKALSELKELKISIGGECSHPPAGLECGPVSRTLREVVIGINLPSNTVYNLHSTTDGMVDSLLKSVLRSNQITKVCLPNISRETMAGVRSILLHCPSLVSLILMRTRLGYDGILYICSALRNNTSLTHLLIHDLPMPTSRSTKGFLSFSSMERVALPDKTTCTDFLLELNNFLKDNNTLKAIDIQCGLFLPLSHHGHSKRDIQTFHLSSARDREYQQWTGVGSLQQFNVGAVGSGKSPNLRRSFSSSDLTQPQTLLFWKQPLDDYEQDEFDFKRPFSKRKDERASFTAPDTEVLQSFSGLDPRLKQCLGISQFNDKYVKWLRNTYTSESQNVSFYTRIH